MIDVDACTKAGILVCNQSGANKEAVAEHAVGLMLAISKKIMETDRAMRKESNIERFRYIGTELLGKTIGIIGLGNIGSRVAEICRSAFRMTVLAYDPYLSKEKMAARNAEKAELKDILQRADYLTMHCPRTEETFGMIGYDELCLMKPTAFFINTSRGGTYKESDLARALGERKIAGAGIDVFLEEPPPTDHPLMAFDNVILTPHNAGSTRESHANIAIYASDQWIDIFDGKVPPRLINRAAWPKYSERFQESSASSRSRCGRSDRGTATGEALARFRQRLGEVAKALDEEFRQWTERAVLEGRDARKQHPSRQLDRKHCIAARWGPYWRTDPGIIVRKRPVAKSPYRRFSESLTTTAFGTSKPSARKASKTGPPDTTSCRA